MNISALAECRLNYQLDLLDKLITFRGHMGPNKDGRNFFLWLVFMVFIFVGMAVLEKVLEVMRDVTPAQGQLLQELRIQLDRAVDPSQSIGARLEAVKTARSRIDGFPVEETDEFFRARLTALRGEFGKIEQQVLSGSTSSP